MLNKNPIDINTTNPVSTPNDIEATVEIIKSINAILL